MASLGTNRVPGPVFPPRRCASLARLMLISTLSTWAPVVAADDLFEITELPVQGRVVAAQLADFDGDQRQDLMVVTLAGRPPSEQRKINVFLQTSDGSFPESADHSIGVPRWSAVYDIADVKETPGDELVLLRPDGITLLSVATAVPTQWDLPVDGPTTVGASDDERGFEPFPIGVSRIRQGTVDTRSPGWPNHRTDGRWHRQGSG